MDWVCLRRDRTGKLMENLYNRKTYGLDQETEKNFKLYQFVVLSNFINMLINLGNHGLQSLLEGNSVPLPTFDEQFDRDHGPFLLCFDEETERKKEKN